MYELPFKDPQLLAEIAEYSRTKFFSDGDVILQPGDDVVYVPFVTDT